MRLVAFKIKFLTIALALSISACGTTVQAPQSTGIVEKKVEETNVEKARRLVQEQIRLMHALAESLEKKEPVEKKRAVENELNGIEEQLRKQTLTKEELKSLGDLEVEFKRAKQRLSAAQSAPPTP